MTPDELLTAYDDQLRTEAEVVRAREVVREGPLLCAIFDHGGFVSYRDLGSEQQALATGQIEAAVGDLPVWNEYVKNNPGKVTVAAGFDTGERYGLAVKKGGNPKLLQTLNDAITEAKSNGTYDKIYEKWIGTKPTS